MRSAPLYCLFLVLLFAGKSSMAQQANTWYFGRYLGIDFNSGTAVALNDGLLNTTEGVASISDASGHILFYTDGILIRNRLHQVMPNGSNLFGNVSSTQSAVIVPKINDPSRFYVFTVDAVGGPRGLCYSIVNMNLDNGNGDVEVKNVSLQQNVVEKITAVKHCNNRDIWVLAHGTVSDTYYAFLVNPSGINTVPVISHTGAVLPGGDSATLGYMKASPDGKKLAAAHLTRGADVSDYNTATGIVSNTMNLFLPTESYYLPYGIEFSPNGKLVYTTVFYTDPANAQKRNTLFQYDVSLSSPAAIRASKQIISQNFDPIQTYAALQVAPDGKMYMAKNTYKNIAAISDPDVYGSGCNFVSIAIQFNQGNQQSSFGLPTFIQSYFYPVDSFTYVVSCPGLQVDFHYNPSPNVNSVLWDFGDAGSIANSSTLNNPSHVFSAPGIYPVKLIRFTNCGSDTLVRPVQVYTLQVGLGADTTVCANNSLLLNAGPALNGNSFLWQDGSTGTGFQATSSGLYWVEEKNGLGCTRRDSITISFNAIPVFTLGPDTSICAKDSLLLNASSNGSSYVWNTGAISSTIKIAQAGLYWCEVNKGGCIFRDSLSLLSIKPLPSVHLGNDTTVCEGISLVLDAAYPNAGYLWQDGSQNALFTVHQAGTYRVSVTDNGCSTSDTIVVKYKLKPSFTLGPDQLVCPGATIHLQPAVDPSWQFLWQDGSTAAFYNITGEGTYRLSASNSCGASFDDMVVTRGYCKLTMPSAFTPNGDGLNDVFHVLGAETLSSIHLVIFNRWGQPVFETRDKTKGWDGKMNGKMQDPSAFVYLLQYTEAGSDAMQVLKGSFVLVR